MMDYDEKLIDEYPILGGHTLQVFKLCYPGTSYCTGFHIRIDGMLTAWWGDSPAGWSAGDTQREVDYWNSANGQKTIGQFEDKCHRCELQTPLHQLSIMLEKPAVHPNPQMCIDALKAELQKRS